VEDGGLHDGLSKQLGVIFFPGASARYQAIVDEDLHCAPEVGVGEDLLRCEAPSQ
jgi:hypothetical protein